MILNNLKKRRKSRQREGIYGLIKNSREHPTARRIFHDLKRAMPGISLGNVYRNLKILVDEGRVRTREIGDGIEHYDAVLMNHYHFICEQCHSVSDVDLPVQSRLVTAARKKTKHLIVSHTVQFYGICQQCKKIKKGGR